MANEEKKKMRTTREKKSNEKSVSAGICKIVVLVSQPARIWMNILYSYRPE